MNTLKTGLFTLALVFMSMIAHAQNMFSPELQVMIDDFVAERMELGNLPGLALTIIKDGQVAYTKGYGLANVEKQLAMTDHTPVAVASTAKGMTALAIMQLVEQGKVDLDAAVMSYLPWFTVDDPLGSTITVRQILSHNAGLPASGIYDGNRDPDALEQRVRALASVKLSRAPGTGYEYANDGYAIAGLIIQTVSGMPFEDYMAQHIFAPLAMEDSTFDPAQAEQHGLAQGYLKQRGVLSPGPLDISRGQAPAGLLLTSAHDTATYFLMLLSGGQSDNKTIAAKSSIEELWKPQVQLEPELHYGLGWEVSNANGLTVVNHTGSLPSSSSDFILVPSQNLGVGVMVNLSSAHTVEIAEGVVVLMQGGTPNPSSLPTEREPSTFKPDPSVWTQYLGDYESQKGLVRIYVEDGKLMGLAGDVAFELEAYGDNDFVMRGNVGAFEGFSVSFSSADNHMTMLLGGQPFGQKK